MIANGPRESFTNTRNTRLVTYLLKTRMRSGNIMPSFRARNGLQAEAGARREHGAEGNHHEGGDGDGEEGQWGQVEEVPELAAEIGADEGDDIGERDGLAGETRDLVGFCQQRWQCDAEREDCRGTGSAQTSPESFQHGRAEDQEGDRDGADDSRADEGPASARQPLRYHRHR